MIFDIRNLKPGSLLQAKRDIYAINDKNKKSIVIKAKENFLFIKYDDQVVSRRRKMHIIKIEILFGKQKYWIMTNTKTNYTNTLPKDLQIGTYTLYNMKVL